MIYIYKDSPALGSSAKGYAVIKELGITKALTPGTIGKVSFTSNDVILGWGCSKVSGVYPCRFFNKPESITNSANKIKMLDCFSKYGIKTYTYIHSKSEISTIKSFWEDPRDNVCRTLVNSHSGNGIVIRKSNELVVPASLYTKFESYEYEQRLFIVDNRIVDTVQKKKMSSEKLENNNITFDPNIKSNKNGWVYARNNIQDTPSIVLNHALESINAVGLDYGSVDVSFTDSNNFVVIEVNSTPGLSNQTTIKLFTTAIKEMINA